MNLHITYSDKKHMSGFTNIDITKDKESYTKELDSVPTSSCNKVIISEALQLISGKDALDVLQKSISKIRIKGTIDVSISDFEKICTDFTSGHLKLEQLNNFLPSLNSIIHLSEVRKLLAQRNVNLERIEQREYFLVFNGVRLG